jgi:hypothetical protein
VCSGQYRTLKECFLTQQSLFAGKAGTAMGDSQETKNSKRHIYAQILQQGLLCIRNQSEQAAQCHTIADLLHNVPQYILHEDFQEGDFYFLNFEVGSYVAYCHHLNISPDPTLLSLAEQLREIVPEELKAK